MIDKSAIIVFVILGCVVSVLIGYSIHSVATGGFRNDEQERDFSHEQRSYMRELRLRDINWMARDNGLRYNPEPPRDLEKQ
ncbi:hypothetical protein BO82DRAFT_356660 [Aspergillus uvarum CBS 121591]|uniref:Uncharacterized protein n=5 Tax=Aspergillus TaxID=5052 RepID=A0A319C5V2_9EURO|nr:uncharacterized protein ASPACDRAFT_127765 [Aspergillus aculeatus ATCC 16872]XP_025489489.1 hypothetical protein BO82DRAFT_356660 [Aspergillus uvarum CBS 121591]XP_025532778.1 hypothetical protein BO86DRAFT_384884 [Aspergillus japonicus CBS 114.51]PYI18637.1 hypothetical protein BO99DRAFT_403332 [Aspergillus violaceofuscus CBS 115571]PYI35458.1 hypothetical protein BP00DRAFT_334353 [Aspergillus indologenus CBS 114.80]OJJ94870.1 hypothetical protein ASPACDRAFT_127765 [Aspergillus aculeatus AT